MTDAHLMDADCIHGVTWYDCPTCDMTIAHPINDADKKLIDMWRSRANKNDENFEGYLAQSNCESLMADLFAAFDRALADTPTLVETPERWCAAHKFTGGERYCPGFNGNPCDLRPLVYVEQP